MCVLVAPKTPTLAFARPPSSFTFTSRFQSLSHLFATPPPLSHSPRLASRQISGSRILLARSRFANISRVVGSVSCTLSFLTTHTHPTLHYTHTLFTSFPYIFLGWLPLFPLLFHTFSIHFRYIFDKGSFIVASFDVCLSHASSEIPFPLWCLLFRTSADLI